MFGNNMHHIKSLFLLLLSTVLVTAEGLPAYTKGRIQSNQVQLNQRESISVAFSKNNKGRYSVSLFDAKDKKVIKSAFISLDDRPGRFVGKHKLKKARLYVYMGSKNSLVLLGRVRLVGKKEWKSFRIVCDGDSVYHYWNEPVSEVELTEFKDLKAKK